jgi:tetratricopeptide (TPR) repeat protein
MGALYLKKGDLAKAETSIKEALAREPDSVLAHVLMGDCLLRGKNRDRAELEYTKAVELSPTVSAAQIKLAEFYLMGNNLTKAKKILSEASAKSPEFLPTTFYMAKIAFAEKDYHRAVRLLDAILQKYPNHIDALILRGQVNGAEKRTAEALDDFRAALRINPGSQEALQYMGLAYLQGEDVANARSSFKALVRLDPDRYDPRIRLADLDLRSGDFQSAIDNVEVLLGKGVKEPSLYILLGSAYLGKKDLVKAESVLRKYLEKSPEDARGKYLLGLALRGQGKKAEAVNCFEETLNATPPFLDSLPELVSIDIDNKDPNAALKHVEKQIAASPANAGLYQLLGHVRIVRKELDQAEAAYLKAIEIAPQLVQSYVDLAQVYALSTKTDKALAKLDEIIKIDPKNVGALMLSGILHQQKEDIPEARNAYEAVVALNPGFAAASNNLAYIYCEYLDDTDKALSLAKKARDVEPDNPNIADTLGWVLYKKSNYEWALTYLQGSAAKLPDNAEVLFHLGMVQYRLGNYDDAKQSLSRALEKGGEFKGASEAKRVLSEMAK